VARPGAERAVKDFPRVGRGVQLKHRLKEIPGGVRKNSSALQLAEGKGRMVCIPQGKFDELKSGDTGWFEFITSCTIVYTRSKSGRVVVYHWPFTKVNDSYIQKMEQAVNSINAAGEVSYIKLFTKSKVGLDELISHLEKYSKNIETDIVDRQTEPMIDFDGKRLI